MFTKRIPATLTAALVVAGCATGPLSETDALDPRLAWPCDRLVLSWPAEVSRLREAAGAKLTPVSDAGVGELHLVVMQCRTPDTSRVDTEPLSFGYVAIPVAAESVPVVITSVPADGWYAMPVLFGDREASALFGRMGYDVLPAAIAVSANPPNSEIAMNVQLTFDNGRISAAARAAGGSSLHDMANALVVSATEYVSAFFGEEKAKRYASEVTTIEIEGDTPLSGFGFSAQPATAVIDFELTSDRIYWRLPLIAP